MDSDSSPWDDALTRSADLRRFRLAALKWYDRHGRKLPWRFTADPYRIWLSEIMLQQTTVAAVVPYFERFLAAFPTVRELAESDIDRVLRLWEGLGYYSRARNLHKAANQICREHNGEFPANAEQLNALPGVGRYTAGAIASFAFNLPAPIVEANTERLYARLLGLSVDVKSSAGQKALWSFAGRIVPDTRSGDFNQAMMDLGANVCTPQNPRCSECPLSRCCKAFGSGRQGEIPVRKARTPVTEIDEVAIVLIDRHQVLMRRRTSSERWAGMWDFPRFELTPEDRDLLDKRLLQTPRAGSGKSKNSTRTKSLFERAEITLPRSILEQTGSLVNVEAGQILAATQFRYAVTRYRVTLRAVVCSVDQRTAHGRVDSGSLDTDWFSAQHLDHLPLSQTGRRVADWVAGLTMQPKYQRSQPENSNEAT